MAEELGFYKDQTEYYKISIEDLLRTIILIAMACVRLI